MNEIRIEKADKDFLVVYKPAGIAVQSAGIGAMDLEHWLLGELSEQGGKQERIPYLAVVHRLDQPVEGLLVFARNRRAAANLSAQIQKQQMYKEYLAVTDGIPAEPAGRLTDYLVKDSRSNRSRVAAADAGGAKKAVLEYQCLRENSRGQALVKIRLFTGRHHQIRVQMAHAGMPLAGDLKYNPSAAADGGGLGLCASGLSFLHPVTGERLQFWITPRGPRFRGFDLTLD